MSGVALTTISPSSTSSSRKTPWVDGCWGPIEMVICVSSGRSTTSNCGGMFGAVLIYVFPIAYCQFPISRKTQVQFQLALGNLQSTIISGYMVHNRATENLL